MSNKTPKTLLESIKTLSIENLINLNDEISKVIDTKQKITNENKKLVKLTNIKNVSLKKFAGHDQMLYNYLDHCVKAEDLEIKCKYRYTTDDFDVLYSDSKSEIEIENENLLLIRCLSIKTSYTHIYHYKHEKEYKKRYGYDYDNFSGYSRGFIDPDKLKDYIDFLYIDVKYNGKNGLKSLGSFKNVLKLLKLDEGPQPPSVYEKTSPLLVYEGLSKDNNVLSEEDEIYFKNYQVIKSYITNEESVTQKDLFDAIDYMEYEHEIIKEYFLAEVFYDYVSHL